MHLDRLITVLETIAVAGRPISVAEVHETTGLPRPTCYRLVQALTDHRLLDTQDGGLLIGERLVRIAMLGQADADIAQATAPALKNAAIELGEAVFLSRFRNKGVEIIHVEAPSDPTRSFIHPGLGFRPMHACSCSKAIAAFAEEEFREEILAGPMRAYTERTRTSPDDLRAEFGQIVTRGFAECVEEIEVGVSSVAAPIRVGSVGAIFSVGATGPIRRFSEGYRTEIGAALTTLADRLSAAIQLHGAARN
ncbi:MAG: IclR family transcriptional regulator [Pseudomonadota bacterium]